MPPLSQQLLDVLVCYSWPGNIRELENEVERLMALGREKPELTMDLLSRRITQGSRASGDPRHLASRLDQQEAKTILDALEKEGGNKTRAAKRLGVSRETLRVKMRKHQL